MESSKETSLDDELIYTEANGMKFYHTTFMDITCVRCENGYYNFTKIAQDNGYRDLARITRNKKWQNFLDSVKRLYLIDRFRYKLIYKSEIDKYEYKDELEEITDENIYIEVSNKRTNLMINGRYYPKLLMHHFTSLINYDYCLKISHIVELIDEEVRLRHITTKTWINEQEEQIKALKTRLQNSNAGFNHEHPGSIIIHQTSTRNYKLIYKEVNVDENDYKNDIVIHTVYNIDKMRRLILFYVRNDCVSGVQWKQANIFECEPIVVEAPEEDSSTGFKSGAERLIQLIKDIQGFSLELTFDIDKEITSYLSKNFNNRNKFIGTLFELYCSKKYGVPLFKYNKTELFSLSKHDTGVDLMSIDKSTIIQCKCYNTKLDYKHIQTFIDFCKRFSDWTRILVVSSSTELDANIIKAEQNHIFEIRKIDNNEFLEFCSSLGIDIDEHSESEDCESAQIEDTMNQEIYVSIEEYVNELLKENEEWLLSELLARINMHFHLTISQSEFMKRFDSIYAKTRNGTILRNRFGHPIIRRNIDRESETEWIINTIGFGEYFKEDFIKMHNEHFETDYTSDAYIRIFGSMFEHDYNHKRAIFQRQINKQKRTILRFQMDEEEYNAFKEFIDVRTTFTTFNERFHRYESSASFNKLKARLEQPFEYEEAEEMITLPESTKRIKSLKNIEPETLKAMTEFVKETIIENPIKLTRMQELLFERFGVYLEKHAFTHAFSSLYRKTRNGTIPRDSNDDYILISIDE